MASSCIHGFEGYVCEKHDFVHSAFVCRGPCRLRPWRASLTWVSAFSYGCLDFVCFTFAVYRELVVPTSCLEVQIKLQI